MCKTVKLAIFATHPIQYQVPIWRRLAAMPELDVLVIYGTDMSVRGYKDREFGVSLTWDLPLTEGYRHHFLSTDPSIQSIERWRPSAKGAGRILNDFKPDVALMTAYYPFFHVGAFLALRRRGIPIILRHEASDVALNRNGLKSAIRDFVLCQLYRRIDYFAAIGTEAKNHLRRLGVPENKIGSSPYCVDTDFVEQQRAIWESQRDKLRAELGIESNHKVLLFSGKLIPKKDPLLIAAALAILKTNGQQALLDHLHVVIAGDGELKPAMEAALRPLLGSRLHLLGFLNQGQMGRAYVVADALILASKGGAGETWGLVVNEAMQYGLPTITSDGVGCHVDLIKNDQTGWVFPNGDASRLADAIRAFSSLDPTKATSMKTSATEMTKAYTVDAAAAGLAEAIKSVSITNRNTGHP